MINADAIATIPYDIKNGTAMTKVEHTQYGMVLL